jgi:hypothetical protein
MSIEVVIDGAKFQLQRPSDVAVVKRVLAHFQRRIGEDDWRPFKCQKDAIRTWKRLGGIRLQVIEALGLLVEDSARN